MSKFTASIKIDAVTNLPKVSKAIAKSLSKVNVVSKKLNATLLKNTEMINRMGASARRMGVIMSGVAVAGMVTSIKVGAKYQESLKELSAITGIQGRALEDFGAQAVETSKKFGITASDYLQAVKLIGSAKPELLAQPKLLKNVTDQAIILAKAQKLDLATAVRATTTAMNQFGLGAEDAAKAVNILAAGSKFGSSEVNDIADAMINVGGTAAIFGVSLEETNAALQVLAKRGELGAIAGTRLKSALVQMTKLSDQFNPAVVGLGTAFRNLKDAEIGAEGALQAFGTEGINAGAAMLDLIDTYEDLLVKTQGTDVANEQAAINMATFTQSVARLSSAIQGELIKTFLKYEPALTKVVESTLAFVNDGEKMGKFITRMKILLAGLIGVVTALTIAQIALNVALIANPIGAIIIAVAAAIGLVVAAVAALILNWDKVKAFFTENPFGRLMLWMNPVSATIMTIMKGIKFIQGFRGKGKSLGEVDVVGDVKASDQLINANQSLDVNMKIDQEGRASVTGASSSAGLNFSSQMGMMLPNLG